MSKDLYHIDDGIIELKLKDFIYKDNTLYANYPYFNGEGLILFYAPWCAHCKSFKYDYISIAQHYLNLYPFGAVNCDDVAHGNNKLETYAQIKYYPTLMYVNKDNSITEFNGPLSVNSIIYHVSLNKI